VKASNFKPKLRSQLIRRSNKSRVDSENRLVLWDQNRQPASKLSKTQVENFERTLQSQIIGISMKLTAVVGLSFIVNSDGGVLNK
jgi:hypothetical protein